MKRIMSYRLAAFAVSITLPPPTLKIQVVSYHCRLLSSVQIHVRQEMAEVVLSCPCNGFTPTVFRGLGYDLIEHFEREVILRLKRSKGLEKESVQKTCN